MMFFFTFAVVNKQTRTYNNWIKAMSIVFITVFSLLVINNALFNHTHKTESGKLVNHAHPFSKSTHNHNDGEVCYYDNLQLLTSQDLPKLLPTVYLVLEHSLTIFAAEIFSTEVVGNSKSRAPPCC